MYSCLAALKRKDTKHLYATETESMNFVTFVTTRDFCTTYSFNFYTYQHVVILIMSINIRIYIYTLYVHVISQYVI